MYKVKFTSNIEPDDGISIPYPTESDAERAIADELRFYKAAMDENGMEYDYTDNGIKVELWTPGNDTYAEWERMWKN